MTIAKVVYSLILLSIILALVFELRRLWLDDRLYLGRFSKTSASGEENTAPDDFGRRIVHWHSEMRHHFATAPSGQFAAEAGLAPDVSTPIENPENALSELAITVQNVNITDILTKLRQFVSTPREITGSIIETDDALRATLDVNDGISRMSDDSKVGRQIQIVGVRDDDALAIEIACTLIWRQAGAHQKTIATVPVRDFCNWMRAWVRFITLRDRSRQLGGLGADEIKALGMLHQEISHEIASGDPYLRFLSLRANVNRLLLDHEQDSDERIKLTQQMQKDRLDYLVLLKVDPGNERTKAIGEGRIYAGMRPAIPITAGVLDFSQLETLDKSLDDTDFATTWKNILADSTPTLQAGAAATGVVDMSKNDAASSNINSIGVAIGENLIMAFTYSMDGDMRSNRIIEVDPSEWKAEFRFSSRFSGEDASSIHPISRIVRLPSGQRDSVFLLEIEDHDIEKNPPLRLDPDATERSQDENYMAVIGYPVFDHRLPEDLMKAVLGDMGGVKRAMPGRLLSLSSEGTALGNYGRFLAFEAMTSGGTGGGPVLDLHTGDLIGLNYAGRYQGDGGKFGWALPVSTLLSVNELSDFFREKGGVGITFDEVAAVAKTVFQSGQAVVSVEIPSTSTVEAEDSLAAALDLAKSAGALGYQSDFLPGFDIRLPVAPKPSKILDYVHYAAAINPDRRMAWYVAANVDPSSLGSPRRPRGYLDDKRTVPTGETPLVSDATLFSQNALDRGHLLRRLYLTWGDPSVAEAANRSAMAFANIVPQHEDLNRQSWLNLEEFVQSHMERTGRRGIVFAGPVFAADDPEYRGYKLPQAFWKILVTTDNSRNELRAAAFLIRQRLNVAHGNVEARVEPFDPIGSRVSISAIEKVTGIRFSLITDELRSPF